VGAVVSPRREVFSEAIISARPGRGPTAHAEILAIQAAARALSSWRLEGCTLAVTSSCPMCAGALLNARVERLV